LHTFKFKKIYICPQTKFAKTYISFYLNIFIYIDMSVSYFATTSRNSVTPAIGDIVMYDISTESVEVYDSKNDDAKYIVGCVFPKVEQLGRIQANFDSLAHEDFDYYLFGENRQYDPNEANPNWDPSFNPSTDSDYVAVCSHGLGPVKVASEADVPASWVKIRDGISFHIFLVR
jgi:hypothetical protein